MVLGMFDLGRAFVFGVGVQQGGREAARYASRLVVDPNVSDATVLQRLIDAASPALQGCQPVQTQQTCGGGTWTLTLAATPPGSSTSYNSLRAALANSTNPYLSGGKITVTAAGSVALLNGLCVSGNLCLFGIGVHGQASMAFL